MGLAIQRAEDKTAQMQARAGAIDELIASGALDDMTQIGGGDDITRELDAMSSQSDVESELARLKSASHGGAIEGSSAAGALGAGTSGQPMQAGAEETLGIGSPETGKLATALLVSGPQSSLFASIFAIESSLLPGDMRARDLGIAIGDGVRGRGRHHRHPGRARRSHDPDCVARWCFLIRLIPCTVTRPVFGIRPQHPPALAFVVTGNDLHSCHPW